MRNRFTAFTLGEILITMAIVGIIASLLLSTIKQIRPDKQKMLFKKAYTSVERVVTELVNDDYLYPEENGYVGLDNTTTSVILNNKSYSGSDKFCQLFASKLNNISSDDSDINCPAGALTDGSAGTPSFTTNDSIEFYIPNTDFATDTTISIDTNGDKEPNCKYSDTCKKPDRFEIIVSADGGIKVTGSLERSYLKSSTVAKEN